MKYYCYTCGSYFEKPFSWKYNDVNSEYYDYYDWSNVYKKSKFMTFKYYWDPVPKGAIVKVKIGKKTYKATLKSHKKIKFKFKKKPKYGQKITISLYYKGKLISRSKDYVYYAKKVKTGMTKKQVKYLSSWGTPYKKSSSSRGWSYWFYSGGSYIAFKNGRVQYWYS